MDLLEQFARAHAKRITRNGVPVLITDGNPLLVDAFKKLGWSDPYEEDSDQPGKSKAEEVAVEPTAPEHAVVPHPHER